MLSSSSFYDAVAHEYKNYCTASKANDILHEEIFLLEKYKPKRILELGVGDGRFAKEYIRKNPDCIYTGIDNSSAMLMYADTIKAELIHVDMLTFCKQSVHEGRVFDAIIAPYTAIHHLNHEDQLATFTFMKQLSSLIMINCLTEITEQALFKNTNETTLTFVLPSGTTAETRVYKLHETIRCEMTKIHEGNNRETLVEFLK